MASMESPRKRVRFSFTQAQTDSCPTTAALQAALVMVDKVPVAPHPATPSRRPARRSRSPPTVMPQGGEEDDSATSATASASEMSDTTTVGRNDHCLLQARLERLERAIQASAMRELELMNRAKRLRSKRAAWTHKYERLAKAVREQQRQDHVDAPFTMATLPPLM